MFSTRRPLERDSCSSLEIFFVAVGCQSAGLQNSLHASCATTESHMNVPCPHHQQPTTNNQQQQEPTATATTTNNQITTTTTTPYYDTTTPTTHNTTTRTTQQHNHQPCKNQNRYQQREVQLAQLPALHIPLSLHSSAKCTNNGNNQPCTYHCRYQQREVHRHRQKPALHMPPLLSTTGAATSSSAMFARINKTCGPFALSRE